MARFRASVASVVLAAAALCAQDKTQSNSSASQRPAHTKPSFPEIGAISNGVYHNSSFGFTYKVPFGWVDRTREMREDSGDASKSLLLLAVFERPPEATGDTINSAAVIAAEPLSAYSGLKTAAEYFGPLTMLATAKGFQVVNPPYDFSVGPVHLARGDFTKPRGMLTMNQTSLVLLEKGYEVSFTFIGGSEDEKNELIEKLSFAARKPAR
jgi:hypothetical protein